MSLPARLLLIGTLAALPASADVVINEIMYNTPGGTDVEYVELYNSGATGVDLAGYYLLDDDDLHDRCMLAGILAPGDYLVVAGLLPLFQASYPGVTNVNANPFDSEIAGVGFGLGNASDTVRLFDPSDALVDSVAYTDAPPWPGAADGDGPSLELLNPGVDNAVATNWAASAGGPPFGTPGAQNSVFVEDLVPVVGVVERSVELPRADDAVVVSAPVTDDQPGVSVELFVDLGAGFTPLAMLDDGLQGDAAAADGVFSVTLPAPQPSGLRVRYYVKATDSLGQVTTRPQFAPGVYLAYTVDYAPPPLLINEILASNFAGLLDNGGDADDWLELRNPGPGTVQLGGMYLTDDPSDTTRWPLPPVELGPGEHLLIWCDGEPLEGALHASFSLARSGGEVALHETVDHGNVRIHGFTYGPQGTDISFGYFPDGADAPEFLSPPTPGAPNGTSGLYSPICINEFLATSQLGVPDWVELHNRGAAMVDLGGWFLSDDAAQPFKYAFPAGTLLPAGGFLSVDETVLGFGLSSAGEVIALTHADGLTGQDYYDFGPQLSDISRGRFVDGAASWHSFSAWTRDASNVCPVSAEAPGPVPALWMASPETLTWEAAEGASRYDVIVGDLLALRAAAGDFSGAIVGCLDDNSPDLLAWDPGTGPDPAFYLVRAVNDRCGFGTYDTGSLSQPVSRDAALAAASNACP